MSEVFASIVVPIYNAERYLPECIDSVLALRDERWQLILVNDGSMDASAEICKKYCELDSRIMYIEQKNAGVSAARNVGIQFAVGEWISFLDSDDMLSPNALDVLRNVSTDYDMVIAGITREKAQYTLSNQCQTISGLELQKSILNFSRFKRERDDVLSIDEYSAWTSVARFYRIRVFRQYDVGFPDGIKLGEDLTFCMNYAQRVKEVMTNDSRIYFYRENWGSVTHKFHKDRVENTIKMVEQVAKFLCGEVLVEYLNVFVIDRITKCCVAYYADERNGLRLKEATQKLKELCEIPIFKNAISQCGFSCLAVGKRNRIYNCITLYCLKKKWYSLLICGLKVLNKL